MDSSCDVKLLGGSRSPIALRAMIALSIKSIAYELHEEHVMVSKSDLLLKSNPVYNKIPVLIHNGNPICESLIIVEYIDQVWASGPTFLPSDPYDRAVARFWAAYIDNTLVPKLMSNSMEETTQGLVLLDEAFTKCSNGHNFFGGDKIGYLDIALGGLLPWIEVINKRDNIKLMDQTNTPNLFTWAQHFCADAAVKDVLPDIDFLVSLSKGLATK